MIEITPKNGFRHGFKATGHAEYAEHGHDIVCASISVLIQSFVLGITKHYGEQVFHKLDLEDGYSDIQMRIINPEIEMMLNTLKFTFEELAHQYPENIKILEERYFEH